MTKKVNFSSLSLIKTLQGDIKKKKNLIVKLCFKNIILVMWECVTRSTWLSLLKKER